MVLYTLKNSAGITLITYKEREMDAGYTDTLQQYDECKLVRIMQGRGIWNINGRRFPFDKNDIFLFSRCDVRRLERIESTLKIEQINFIPLTAYPHTHCTDVFFMRKSGFSNKLTLTSNANDIAQSFDTLRKCAENTELAYRDEYIQNLVCRMIITAAQCYPVSAQKDSGYDSVTQRAMKYVSQNLSETLTLRDTAHRFGFSSEHFSRLFLKSSGISFNEYVARCRVNAVICELGQKSTNILESAFKYGFKSSSGFYKTFYRVTGCTPKSFRQQVKTKEL